MSQELLAVFEYIEREKGVSRDVLMQAIQSSLESAAKKSLGHHGEIDIRIDPETAEIKVFAEVEVVSGEDNVSDTMSLKKAQKIQPDIKIGDVLVAEITPKNFGRIAAQTAKQVIIQRLREAEQDNIIAEFQGQVGTIVTGIVRRHSKGSLIIDLGKTEAILPHREQIPGEKYGVGSRITALVHEVGTALQGPQVILTRAHANFVAKLFELEVPEIATGTVEIKGIAREAGYRTKVAVYSKDPKIDCVGACVGLRGARVKNVVRELEGEKVDIVRYDDDIAVYVENALSPAKLNRIEIDEDDHSIVIFVDPDQLSLSIGRKGQNARLTSKLLKWKVDVFAEKEGLGQSPDEAEEDTQPEADGDENADA